MGGRVLDHALLAHTRCTVGLELGFDQGHQLGVASGQRERYGQHLQQADEAGITDDQGGRRGYLFGRQLARVGLFQIDDARIGGDARVHLPLPYVYRKNLGCAAIQTDLGEATCRCANIHGNLARHVQWPEIKGALQFKRAATDPAVGIGILDVSVFEHL